MLVMFYNKVAAVMKRSRLFNMSSQWYFVGGILLLVLLLIFFVCFYPLHPEVGITGFDYV